MREFPEHYAVATVWSAPVIAVVCILGLALTAFVMFLAISYYRKWQDSTEQSHCNDMALEFLEKHEFGLRSETVRILPMKLEGVQPLCHQDRRSTLPTILLTTVKTEKQSSNIYDNPETSKSQSGSPRQRRISTSPRRRFSSCMGSDDRSISPSKERFSICEANSIDPALYRTEDDPNQAALNLYGLGKLCFSLSYDRQHSLLYGHIHRASYLASLKPTKSGSFYVKVSLLPDEKEIHRTAVVSMTRSPEFEEEFSFPIPKEEMDGRKLLFVVKEAHRMEKNEVIGNVLFGLSSRYLLSENQDALQDIWRDIIGKDKAEVSNGHILVSLCYRRAEQGLRVRIHSCRDLAIRSHDSSVYVRASLMSAERAIKAKRTRGVKRDLANPQIDEPMSFPLSLDVTGCVCLSLFVCSRSSLGFSHLIGKCVIGPLSYADGDGLCHWSDMLSKPDVPVLFWHKLE